MERENHIRTHWVDNTTELKGKIYDNGRTRRERLAWIVLNPLYAQTASATLTYTWADVHIIIVNETTTSTIYSYIGEMDATPDVQGPPTDYSR